MKKLSDVSGFNYMWLINVNKSNGKKTRFRPVALFLIINCFLCHLCYLFGKRYEMLRSAQHNKSIINFSFLIIN